MISIYIYIKIFILINRCFEDIKNFELNLISNNFNGNKAINGGALFIRDDDNIYENDDDDDNVNILIENNIFQKNIAENFGGAICSEYSKLDLAKALDNEIIYNKAGIMGGGIYTSNSSNKNLFNNECFKFENNTINSYINNYTSKPSYIALETKLTKNPNNIITGDYFPLSFTIHDIYDNVINDITKYYSSLLLKVVLTSKNKNKNKNGNTSNVKILGNIGSFLNGNYII